jgi:hypothetical protein
MEEACGIPFADSYLSGASEGPGSLMPRTWVAWDRLRLNGAATWVLRALSITLLRPSKPLPHA